MVNFDVSFSMDARCMIKPTKHSSGRRPERKSRCILDQGCQGSAIQIS
ncbi:hypothetical protein SMJ63A_60240 [Stenotrophomonas geniculata]